MDKQIKTCVSLNKSTKELGVKKAEELYSNKRSFSTYIETLIIKDNE